MDFRCDEDTSNPYELPGVTALFVVNVTYCPPDGFPSYVTDDVLAGSYGCEGSNQTSSWSFSKN